MKSIIVKLNNNFIDYIYKKDLLQAIKYIKTNDNIKTPFRISFVGGGTDGLKKQNFAGHIVSTTINQLFM